MSLITSQLLRKKKHRTPDDTAAAYAKEWESFVNPDGPIAASYIEALEKERDELRATVDTLKIILKEYERG